MIRAVDSYADAVKKRNFDLTQGALFVISALIQHLHSNGGLDEVKKVASVTSRELSKLWQMCGRMARASDKYAKAIMVSDSNPFA